MTFKEVCKAWRRAENKAELLRLENEALQREVEALRIEAESLKEAKGYCESILEEYVEENYSEA